MSNSKLLRAQHRSSFPIPNEQLKAVLDCLSKTVCRDIQNAVLLAAHTGMRMGEVLSLTPGHIDLGRGILTVPSRIQTTQFQMCSEVLADMQEYTNHPARDFIFLPNLSRTAASLKLREAFARACEEVLGTRLPFYALRVRFAREMVKNGCSTEKILRVMGCRSNALLKELSL